MRLAERRGIRYISQYNNRKKIFSFLQLYTHLMFHTILNTFLFLHKILITQQRLNSHIYLSYETLIDLIEVLILARRY